MAYYREGVAEALSGEFVVVKENRTEESTRRFTPGRIARICVAVVALGLLLSGLGLRLWELAHITLNADEAVVGLMADAVLRGHFMTFYWGQPYGGVEPYVASGLFALFGHSAYVLTFTATFLTACSTVAVYFLAKELFDRRPAAVAAVLAWIWPASALWNSAREYGFRCVTLLLGLIFMTIAARLVRAGSSPWRWIALGLTAGVGWWASPEMAYFVIPSAILLVWATATAGKIWPSPARGAAVVIGVIAAAFGTLPWLLNNIAKGFTSLSNPPGVEVTQTYFGRLHTIWVESVPMALGLRHPGTGNWVGGPQWGLTLCIVIGVVIVIGLIGTWLTSIQAGLPLTLFVALFTFLMASFPQSSYWNDGRYAIYLPPILAVIVVGGWEELLWSLRRAGHRRLVAPFLSVCLLLSASGATLNATLTLFPLHGEAMTLNPVGNHTAETVIKGLERHGVTRVIAHYWVAYDIDFLAAGKVIATPISPIRVPIDKDKVYNTITVAWLFPGTSPHDQAVQFAGFATPSPSPLGIGYTKFASDLRGLGVAYKEFHVGPLVAIQIETVTGARVVHLFTA